MQEFVGLEANVYAYVRRDHSSTIHIIMLFDFSNLVIAPKFTEPFCYTIKLCELSLALDSWEVYYLRHARMLM